MLRHALLILLLLSVYTVHSISVSTNVRPETCGNINGSAWCIVGGGQAPYSYIWTGPNNFTATSDSIYALEAGTYSLTVTDDLGATASANAVVDDLPYLLDGVGPTWAGAMSVTGYWGGACEGQCNGAGAFFEAMNSGDGPFSYQFSSGGIYLGETPQTGPVYGGFCLGDWVTYTFSDVNGCAGSGSFSVYGIDGSWNPIVQLVEGTCSGGQAGSITLQYQGMILAQTLLRLNGTVVDVGSGAYGSTMNFVGLAPGDYEAETTFNTTLCTLTQTITVPDLGPDCGTIAGTSWYDVDNDCVFDGNEVGIPNSVLNIEPGGYLAITHWDGSYALSLPAGNYTLDQTDPTLVPNCPPTLPVPFALNGNNVVQDLANSSTAPLDLHICAASTSARPGFDHGVYAHVSNASPQVSGPVTVICTYDPTLTYLSAIPAPDNISGNTLTWDLPAFGSFGQASFHIVFNVPASTPIGTVLTSTFNVSSTLNEDDLTDNTDVLTRAVTGSFDPNTKEVRTSSGESSTQYFIGTDTWLDYTIRFQNTGTDTAFNVVVTDTLPAELDMATFVPGPSSHPCTIDFRTGRVVRWSFNDILLPDSATNESLSHGLTSFRIRVAQPEVPSTTISNSADIFFDFNAPVRTPEATVVVELPTVLSDAEQGTLHAVPNPAHDRIVLLGNQPAARIMILAMDGRTLIDHRMNGESSVDISALPAGTYAVRISAVNGQTCSERLITW